MPSFCSFGNSMMLLILALASSLMAASASDFNEDFVITWGDGRGQIIDKGQLLMLSLDNVSGSAFQSKDEYLFGRFDMQIKLVPGNSAGTVATFYLSSQGDYHDEIDFEFLGNSSGEPYTIHTNIYTQGKGNREQQFHLWFDPTLKFHTYSIVWNSQQIIFMVNKIPIRVFKNRESDGIAYPNKQPMMLYASLWDAEDWATRGGLVKTNWSDAPFKTYYKNFNGNACVMSSSGVSSCDSKTTNAASNDDAWQTEQVGVKGQRYIKWVQKNYMIYNYCTDRKRFSDGLPQECKRAKSH